MRTKLLLNSGKVLFLSFFFLVVPIYSYAGEANEYPFPYFMKDAVERKMVYSYAFDNVWNAVLSVAEDMNKEADKLAQEKRLKELKKDIKSDKNSGLIIVMNTHKGKRGFFSTQLPVFSTSIFYIKPLEGQKTQVFCRRINYCAYSQPILDAYGRFLPGPCLTITPLEGKILKEIENKLKEQSNEKKES